MLFAVRRQHRWQTWKLSQNVRTKLFVMPFYSRISVIFVCTDIYYSLRFTPVHDLLLFLLAFICPFFGMQFSVVVDAFYFVWLFARQPTRQQIRCWHKCWYSVARSSATHSLLRFRTRTQCSSRQHVYFTVIRFRTHTINLFSYFQRSAATKRNEIINK